MTHDHAVRVKHLKMVHKIVERMADNSFLLKKMSVAMFLVFLICSIMFHDKSIMVLSYPPIIAYYMLDVFYIQRERRFRTLYGSVLRGKIREYSLDISSTYKCPLIKIAIEKHLMLFYGCLIVSVFLVLY